MRSNEETAKKTTLAKTTKTTIARIEAAQERIATLLARLSNTENPTWGQLATLQHLAATLEQITHEDNGAATWSDFNDLAPLSDR